MNYFKIYQNLVDRARNRPSTLDYMESHHIIPRCLDGCDDESNLIDLTPEEHYFAHQLLIKMYPNESTLAYAAKMMTIGSKRRSNKLYGWIRRQFSTRISEELTGKRYFHNPTTGKILIVKKDDLDPTPDSGFIKGRGYSPTKGKSYKKTGIELERMTEMCRSNSSIAGVSRWEKYENDRIENGIGSTEFVKSEIIRLNDEYENKTELVEFCMTRFNLSKSKIYKIIRESGYVFESRMDAIIRTVCEQIGIESNVMSLKKYLTNEYDFTSKRPPF